MLMNIICYTIALIGVLIFLILFYRDQYKKIQMDFEDYKRLTEREKELKHEYNSSN